jgi:hypothetical protein
MGERSELFGDEVYQDVLRASPREPDVLAPQRKATASEPNSVMQIGSDQGQLMA